MTKPDLQLTKTCSSCGVRKPLSAFMQLSGPGGGIYGGICNACRKANAEKAKEPNVEADDGTNVTFQKTIDAKSKLESDHRRKQDAERIEEEYHEERDEAKILAEKLSEKKSEKQHEEKDHREEKLQKDKKPANAGDVAKAEAIKILTAEHAQKTGVSLNQGPVDFGRVAQIRFTQSAIFNTFKSWLGGSAPIISHVEKAANAAKHSESLKSDPSVVTSREGFLGKKVEQPQNPMVDYAEKTWGPGQKK